MSEPISFVQVKEKDIDTGDIKSNQIEQNKKNICKYILIIWQIFLHFLIKKNLITQIQIFI